MDNEYYELQRKFEVLAETPVKNLEEYVRLTCEDLKIFMFEASKENSAPSLNARTVIDIVNRESSLLGVKPNAWLVYNGFNEILHGKLKKSFQNQRELDARLFNHALALAGS